jgi:hypothetical protein
MVINEPFKFYASKVVAIVVSFLGGLIGNPVMYFIIQYERDKHYRTLINQILSLILYNTMIFGGMVQFVKLYHYSVGSLHWFFCYVDVFFSPICMMVTCLFLNAMCLIRYLFVFHLKNPNAMQNDFWKLFLAMWVNAVAILTTIAYYILPGSFPNFYYICLRKIPKNHNYTDAKGNATLLWLLIFTIILHLFTALRYQVYKYNEKKFMVQMTEQQKMYCLHVNQSSIVNFATNSAGVVYMIMLSYVPNKLNVTNPIEFNTYPEYLWLYVNDMYIFATNYIFIALTLMYRNPQLQSFCKRQTSELIKKLNRAIFCEN